MTDAAVRVDTPSGRRAIRVVGRYALYDEIAAGGMATVHFGRLLGPVGFSRAVAIKRLHDHHANDPQFTKMFIEEARLASRIQHPNVVATLDVISEGGEILLVMDYVQGESLARLLRNSIERGEPVPLRVALAVMSNVLHGLHAAHEAKNEAGQPLEVVHRDVSPQNVMVGVDGIARVLDFGIARAKLRSPSLDEGAIKGKVSYMAPEQLAAAPLDRRTDVYAAAVMLWELLAGRRLWQRSDAETSLLDKMFKPIERPSMYREDVPDALDGIVLHGLERDADRRFATAREFALAIEQYGPLAPASEVGLWVLKTAGATLSQRQIRLAEYESDPPILPALAENPGEPAKPDSLRPGQMTSDTYRVTRERATVADKKEARANAEPRASMRASVIMEEVRKFSPWRRRATLAALGAMVTLGAVLVGLGLRGSVRHGNGASSAPAQPSALAVAGAPLTTGACPSGMVAVPAGKLFIGDDEGTPLERPAHQVSLGAFCIDAMEVTVERYKECSDKGDCKRAPTTNEWDGLSATEARLYDPLCNARDPERRKNHPINCIGWEMASAYCAANAKRLPTEAEWEYAARGSDGRKYPWGDDAPQPALVNACGKECSELGKQSKLPLDPLYAGDDGWPSTAPVGSYPRGRSRFGAYDLVGNVAEWTADYYAPYTNEPQVDPKGPANGRLRVVRGGAWNASSAASLRPTARHRDAPDKRSYAVGFRCAAPQRVD